MRQEVQVARHFRNIRDRLHRGPLHTVLSDKARIGKDRQSKLTKEFDPFSDMPTYSQRYKQAQHDLPRFNTRIYREFLEKQMELGGGLTGRPSH